VYGPKNEDVGNFGQTLLLHNEEIRDLVKSLNIVRIVKFKRQGIAKHEARMEEKSNASRILMREHLGQCPLQRPR
jgi:hypothetical protein